MNNPLENGDDPESADFLEQILSSILGPDKAKEASRAMRSEGFSLSSMGADSNAIANAMSQFRFLFTSSNDPVLWPMVEDIGRQMSRTSSDPKLSSSEIAQARQSLMIADLWLDPVTDFAVHDGQKEVWTRGEWIESTLPAWKKLVDPIAFNVSLSLTEKMLDQVDYENDVGVPDQFQMLSSALQQAFPKVTGMSFAAQVGQGLSEMAKQSLGSSDSGFPLTSSGVAALIPTNIKNLSKELGEDQALIQQYVAVREMARVRLFAGVPWIRYDLKLAVLKYAEEITVDTDAINDAVRSFDPSDPKSLGATFSGSVFSAEPTESQQRALEKLETLLSLIEGWVEIVTAKAVAPYLPGSSKLQEMMRRRQIAGSSADQVLNHLVGIQLRPVHARNAAKIFLEQESIGGIPARDKLWAHPDTVPTSQDLKEPDSFFQNKFDDDADDYDLGLEKLLAGTLKWDEAVPKENRSKFGSDTQQKEPESPVDDTEEDSEDN